MTPAQEFAARMEREHGIHITEGQAAGVLAAVRERGADLEAAIASANETLTMSEDGRERMAAALRAFGEAHPDREDGEANAPR